ncbi:MAG: homoserine kinase [Chloroflexi bacterium]|nr:homoserine kinase [Chloroflexota bacterium]GIW11218.1 MAG: homoserine kinase [Dehalococcoidia bacterium]
MSVVVRVPASTANLGPGFDCLGMALALYNEIRLAPADAPRITIQGEGADRLQRDPSNLAYRCATLGYQLSGRPAPPFALELVNRVPLARGLGSSSTAIVGGLLAGATLARVPLSPEQLVTRAAEIEGHPDNVAPAVYGGCTVAVVAESVRVARVPVPADLSTVIFVPAQPLATRQARQVLPDVVSRSDAVFNLGRAALLVAALCADQRDLLPVAQEDRLHQDARTVLMPALPALLAAAREAGALLAALSGAGPSVLALVDDDAEAVAAALAAAAQRNGLEGQVLHLPISQEGAHVVA